jgi:hypothetical protein
VFVKPEAGAPDANVPAAGAPPFARVIETKYLL